METSPKRYYIEGDIIFEERLNRYPVASASTVMSRFAATNEKWIHLGPIYAINNPFHEMFPDTPPELQVNLHTYDNKIVHEITHNFIPVLERWKLDGDSLSLDIRSSAEDEPSFGSIYNPIRVLFPTSWGVLKTFVETVVTDDTTKINNIFQAFVLNGNAFRNTEFFLNNKYMKLPWPNTYSDCRICVGDMEYRSTDDMPLTNSLLVDAHLVEKAFEHVGTAASNYDIEFNLDFLTLDLDYNQRSLAENITLINRGKQVPNPSDSTLIDSQLALLGWLQTCAAEVGGRITDDKLIVKWLTT